MSASSKRTCVTIPRTTIDEGELLTVKWWRGNRLKVGRFHINTDDRICTLDSLFVRENPRSARGENYYIRDATLDDIPDSVLQWMQVNGYEPAREGAE